MRVTIICTALKYTYNIFEVCVGAACSYNNLLRQLHVYIIHVTMYLYFNLITIVLVDIINTLLATSHIDIL